MSNKAAHREYRLAVAEFERGLRAFSESVGRILDPLATERPQAEVQHPSDGATRLLGTLGPRRPAKRALRTDPVRPREAGLDG
ncbi:MAG TPA: hypothetical protein VGI11_16320 [Variovorax sp.]